MCRPVCSRSILTLARFAALLASLHFSGKQLREMKKWGVDGDSLANIKPEDDTPMILMGAGTRNTKFVGDTGEDGKPWVSETFKPKRPVKEVPDHKRFPKMPDR